MEETLRRWRFSTPGSFTSFRMTLLMLLCASVVSAQTTAPVTSPAAADFTLHPDQVIADPFVGFGAQFNAWVYCAPNWGSVNEENVKDLERKVIDLAPQHVRVFVEVQPESRQQRDLDVNASVIRTIELAKRAGATVNCTLWHGPYYDFGQDAQMMVDMLVDFVRGRGLTNIRYVTLQNEPNGFGMDKVKYSALYREFDRRLRGAGLRGQVKIIGGDLLATNRKEWVNFLGDKLADVCDGYSFHMYADYNDWKKIDPVCGEVREMVAALPVERRQPMYLTEFGFRGKRVGREEPGRHEDGSIITDKPAYALACGWRMIDAIRNGFVATLHWDAYDAMYDRDAMHYGMIGGVADGWPLRPHYFLMRMFTHTAKPEWRIVQVSGRGRDGMLVAAMKSPKDEWTVYAVNRTEDAREISVDGFDKTAISTFHQFVWNGDGDGRVASTNDVSLEPSGRLRVLVPARAVVAVTTFESGLK